MDTLTLLNSSLRFDGILVGDSAYVRRRATHLEWAQEVVDEFVNERPWSWRVSSTPITIASGNNSATLPADFQEVGALGGLFDTQFKKKLNERSPQEVFDEQIAPPKAVQDDYAIAGVLSGASGLQSLIIGNNSGNQTYTLKYLVKAPTLVDQTDPGSGMDKIPISYHYTIVLQGLKAKVARANGDGRGMTEWEGIYRRNLARAIAIEGQGRHSSVQHLPRNVPAGMW